LIDSDPTKRPDFKTLAKEFGIPNILKTVGVQV